MKARTWSLVYSSHLNFHKIKERINFSRSTKIGSTPLKSFIAAGQKRIKNYLLTLLLKGFDNLNSAYVFILFLTQNYFYRAYEKYVCEGYHIQLIFKDHTQAYNRFWPASDMSNFFIFCGHRTLILILKCYNIGEVTILCVLN